MAFEGVAAGIVLASQLPAAAQYAAGNVQAWRTGVRR
jgi:hypothetical protein